MKKIKNNQTTISALSRYIMLTFFVLKWATLSAQDYQNRFKADICSCIETKGPSVRSLDSTYQQCFREVLVNYTGAIDQEIQEAEPSVLYVKRQQRRTELMIVFQHELIYTCDFYYELQEKGRQLKLSTMRANAERSMLKKLDEYVALNPNTVTYTQRGVLYFALEDLEKARQDLEKALSINAFAKDAQIMLSWVLEEKGMYSCLLYTSPSPRDQRGSRMPSTA